MRFFTVIGVFVLLVASLAGGQDVAQPPGGSGVEAWDLTVRLDPKISIGKISDFLNDPKLTATGRDKVLKQEFAYFNYGAVTKAQAEALMGHYYTVNFTNDGPPADIIIRMDFRQSLSRDKVNTLEVPFKAAKGGYKQRFVIAGEMYRVYGDVNSWRISVVKDGKIVAQKKSYVW
jgi:hypothetical protein